MHFVPLLTNILILLQLLFSFMLSFFMVRDPMKQLTSQPTEESVTQPKGTSWEALQQYFHFEVSGIWGFLRRKNSLMKRKGRKHWFQSSRKHMRWLIQHALHSRTVIQMGEQYWVVWTQNLFLTLYTSATLLLCAYVGIYILQTHTKVPHWETQAPRRSSPGHENFSCFCSLTSS